jgi:hypothetical protein
LNFGPNFTPDCLARALPSLVRKAIRSRSNSAIPPSIVSISLPTADEVLAHGSANEMKLAFFDAVALTMFSKSLVDLAKRSNRVTTNVSSG